MFTTLSLFFLSVIVTLGSFLVVNKNPMYSIFTLVSLFIASAGVLVGYKSDFFGLLFIIVYIGAIAVLFLFIIMMLDLKEESNSKNMLLFLLSVFFTSFILFNSLSELVASNPLAATMPITPYLFFDSFFNINTFGLYFYLNYGILFLLAGLVLVVALIGAITLILHYNNNQSFFFFDKKLAKSSNFLVFFSSSEKK